MAISFSMDVGRILQYAFNMFSSVLPVIYLFIGGAFAIYCIGKVYNTFRT